MRIIAFKHEDIASKVLAQTYDSLYDFAEANFNIKIASWGSVVIDGTESTVSYSIGDGKNDTYTKEEALEDYVKSNQFLNYTKSRFWSIYKLGEKIV